MLDHMVRVNSGTKQLSYLLVIQESSVLLRVEHLKKSTGRVAVDSFPDLVDLIDEDQRILNSNAFECLDDLPGEGTVDTWSIRISRSAWCVFAKYPT